MLKFIIFTVTCLVGNVFSRPQLLPLNKFSAGAIITLNGIDDDAKLYLASNDDNSVLRNIQLRSGSVTTTLDQLNNINNDGSPKYLNLTYGLELHTTNSDTVTSQLTGSLYITSYAQAKDPNFSVCVVKTSHTVSVMGMSSTVVVLNTQYQGDSTDIDKPWKTTYVTNIDQSRNTNLYFQWGIPPSNWLDATNNTFFRNPIRLDGSNGNMSFNSTQVFFDNVEPLQVNLDAWYFRAFGPMNIDLENKYVGNHNYKTTNVNTTGLVMNNFLYKEHVVNFMLDRSRARTSGFYVSAIITSNLDIIMNSDTSINSYGMNETSEVGVMFWSPMQATKLTINSTSLLPGTFYCQYFGFSGDLVPVEPTSSTVMSAQTTVATGKTSTTTVATTTKESSPILTVQLLVILIASLIIH